MTVNLVTFTRKNVRKDFAVADRPIVIGRKTDADIVIPLAEVSRAHCEVSCRGNKVYVRDLDSRNGTFVNDQKIVEAAVKAGDHIRVGPVTFLVQIDGVPAHPQPPAARPVSPAASPTETTRTSKAAPAAAQGEFDLDVLEELDVDDLSDLDLSETSGSDLLDEEIEEISESDLVPDDEEEEKK